MDDFPVYLRNHMNRLDLSQTALSGASGVSQSQISRWLKGEGGVPSVDNARSLAEALRRPLLEVLVAARILQEDEIKQRVDVKTSSARRGLRPDLSTLSDKELLEEIRQRLQVADANRPLSREEAESAGMVTGRAKRPRSVKTVAEA